MGPTIIVDVSSVVVPLAFTKDNYLLQTSYCQPVQVMYEMFNWIKDMGTWFDTNQFVFCLEGGSAKRKALYPEYKANRKDKTQELKLRFDRVFQQVNKLSEYLSAIGFPVYRQVGYEADDLCASIALNNPQRDFIIATSDHDLLQCLRPNVRVYMHKNNTMWTEADFRKTYGGIRASSAYKIWAICGDKGDNIPSVHKGIGIKKAIAFLTGKMADHCPDCYSILENRDIYDLNVRLVKLPFQDLKPIKVGLIAPDKKVFDDVIFKLEMNSFMNANDNAWWIKFFKGEL